MSSTFSFRGNKCVASSQDDFSSLIWKNRLHYILAGNFADPIYAVTLKQIGKKRYVDEHTLYSKLVYMCRDEDLIRDIVFELDSQNVLHIHGSVHTEKGYNFFIRQQRGWHIHIKRLEGVDDVIGWNNYCHKEAKNYDRQLKILLLNNTRNLNLFELFDREQADIQMYNHIKDSPSNKISSIRV